MKSLFTVLTLVLTFFSIQANTIVVSENFDTCPTDWDFVSTSGSFSWNCATYSGKDYVGITDYNGGTEDDWLISPSVNLNLYAQEYLSFEYLNRGENDGLTLLYSTNYNGVGTTASVNAATWTNMPLDLYDIDGNTFVSNYLFHSSLDLSGISGTDVYFAFRFESSSSETRIWQLDNFLITADYYEDIEAGIVNDGDKCAALKTGLSHLIDEHTRIGYSSSSLDVWDAFLMTDRRMNDAGTQEIVWDMYSDNPTGAEPYEHLFGPSSAGGNQQGGTTQSAEGQFFNREHVFPKSWWGGGTNTIDTSYTDLHHIVPSDSEVNSIKSNYPMGESNSPNTSTMNGCNRGLNSTTGYNGQIFEPIDEYKGDFARILLYISTRYAHEAADWESNYTDALDGNPYTFYDVWLRTLLLEWHENDPVSQKEIDRNNAIYSIQGNRNPFIDRPEYVFYIWGRSNDLGCPTVLPVELLSFDGEADKNQNSLLEWQTATESNSSHFEIQHSLNGTD
ncbi:MAG: endonuclease, partial [Saprospiraceae bacterium]